MQTQTDSQTGAKSSKVAGKKTEQTLPLSPYAVVETGGKQVRVSPGEIINIEKLEGQVGDLVKLDRVLLIGGMPQTAAALGTPYLAGALLEGEIVSQTRGDKILIIKMKRRKGYRRTQGHRQAVTRLLVTRITDASGSVVSEFDTNLRKQALMKASIASKAPQKKTAKTAKSADGTVKKTTKKAVAKKSTATKAKA